MDPVTVQTSAAVAKAAAQFAALAQRRKWPTAFLDAFKRKHPVLVLGSTGVGKSNLLDSLVEAMPIAIDAFQRTEYVKKSRLKLDRTIFDFVDTPGQKAHAVKRRAAIRRALADGGYGVINVVSYGYHEYRGASRLQPIVDGTANPRYLQDHLRVELDLVNEWASLRELNAIQWLITVVTKADLWWDRRDEVLEYYSSGPYSDAIGPALSVAPVVVPHCSVVHKFFGTGPLSGAFDDHDRGVQRGALVGALLAAAGEPR